MLKVTVEIVPLGHASRARTIGTMRLSLIQVRPGNLGDYDVEIEAPDPDYLVRADGRIERLCAHGVGHTVGQVLGVDLPDAHGCDGCCAGYATGLRQIPPKLVAQFEVLGHRRQEGAYALVRTALEVWQAQARSHQALSGAADAQGGSEKMLVE
jgi:hypothetical protein